MFFTWHFWNFIRGARAFIFAADYEYGPGTQRKIRVSVSKAIPEKLAIRRQLLTMIIYSCVLLLFIVDLQRDGGAAQPALQPSSDQVSSGCYWSDQVSFGCYWSDQVSSGCYWSDQLWLLLVRSGQFWLLLVWSGQLWLLLVRSGQLWLLLVRSGQLWLLLVRSGQLWLLLVRCVNF